MPGFGFRHGEVWAVHLAWSGKQRWLAERLPEGAGVHGAALGAGELLAPGEIRLSPGESYTAPTALFAWSDAGLDGLAGRYHTLLRARPGHPTAPRPRTLNSWEAVYFGHDPHDEPGARSGSGCALIPQPRPRTSADAAAAVSAQRSCRSCVHDSPGVRFKTSRLE